MSSYSDRSGSWPLDKATVSEDIFVFVDPEGDDIEEVEFYLDDPGMDLSRNRHWEACFRYDSTLEPVSEGRTLMSDGPLRC